MSTEVLSFFHAEGCRRVSTAVGDGDERITLHVVPSNAVDGWLAARLAAGRHVAAMVYAGLYLSRVKPSG
jgi:hypothetical protein